MTEYQKKRAEEVEKYGLDTMLDALAQHCSGGNCPDCWYLNRTDETCEVFNYIERMWSFPLAEQVSCGERRCPPDCD